MATIAIAVTGRMLLSHDVIGEGARPLILLHGFLGAGRNVGALARRLSVDDPLLRIYLPDHLGHGSSPDLPSGADLSTLGEAVLSLIDELGATAPVPIVGHSLGGRVALAAKRIAPGRVGRVVLLDIAPGPTAHLPASGIAERLAALPDEAASRQAFAEALIASGLERALVNWLLMNVQRGADGTYRWRIDREALLGFHRRSGVMDLWDVLDDGADVRAIRGERSPYVTEDDVDRFGRLGVTVRTVEGAGHFLHTERPKETHAHLIDALG